MPQLKLTFSKATPSDLTRVGRLVESAYRGDSSRAGWTTEADLLIGDRIDAAELLTKITEPHGAVILVHDETNSDNDLLACFELLQNNDVDLTGYFGLFAVDPQRQGGGIGRAVLAEAERYAREEWGLKRLEMRVIWIRGELIDWYVRRGWTKTETTSKFPYEVLDGERRKATRDDLHFVHLERAL